MIESSDVLYFKVNRIGFGFSTNNPFKIKKEEYKLTKRIVNHPKVATNIRFYPISLLSKLTPRPAGCWRWQRSSEIKHLSYFIGVCTASKREVEIL